MFLKPGRDEVLMAPHMHLGVLARSTQGQIQGRAKIGDGALLQESASSDWKATATNQMYSNDLEACGMKCCYFWFHSEVNFLCVHCSQVSDSGLLGLLLLIAHQPFFVFCYIHFQDFLPVCLFLVPVIYPSPYTISR